ncbi:MAG: tetratricopeptide repeat protein [Saprospirales bacterium]|nr:tetratricopeptide repeat protein [Saprospirales bacterium]
MNLSIKHFLLFFTSCFLFYLPVQAQEDGRLSEKKIKEQELFIEANKFRLLGNLDKASELFQELLKKDRQNDAAAYELARIYTDQNNNREALNYAKQAAAIAPDNLWYQRFLADNYQRNNLFHEAALIYEQLVAKAPSDEYNYFKWAYYLVQDGQNEKALEVYNQLENRNGINEELSRRKHSLYLGIGDTKSAEKELVRLSEAFPGNTDFLHLLAGFYRQMNNSPAALATFKKILEIDPNDSKAYFAISSLETPGSDDDAFLHSLEPIFQNPQVDLDDKIMQILPYAQKAAATDDQALANGAPAGLHTRSHSPGPGQSMRP